MDMMSDREDLADECDLMGPALPPHLAAARAGDPQAFDQLVRPLLAEDLLQEGLTRCWQGLARFRGEASFRSWLVGILYRLAREPERLQAGRLQPRAGRLEVDIPERLPLAPLDRMTTRELLERVEQAMERLPLRQRTALHLRAVQGWSYGEIAAAMATSSGAARTAVFEARNRLRERVGDLL